MQTQLLECGDGFWNLRGSYKVAGLINIGTQSSLARMNDGSFVLLDSIDLSSEQIAEIRSIAPDGIEAILHLHPFHTLHVRKTHQVFPDATLYGTDRHKQQAPDLPWADETTDSAALQERFADTLAFFQPRGVPLVAHNEDLHFGSILALHKPSQTLHVDDTLVYVPLPLIGGVRFHPTLGQVLERRPGAGEDFRAWAEELAAACADVEHLATAHTRALCNLQSQGHTMEGLILGALQDVESTLRNHAQKYPVD